MTTVSPTPFAHPPTFGNPRPRHTSSRTLPRAQPLKPALRRDDHFDTFSHSQGFSAGAPMLRSISYGDSSDDEIPKPMSFSAQTWAILESKDRSSVGSRSPQRQPPLPTEARYSHSRHDSIKSTEQKPVSRSGTPPSRGELKVVRKSPPPEAQEDGVSPPRVVHLSGSRRSSGPRRTASSADVRPKDAGEKVHDYITPAPAPRTRPLTSRANSMTSTGPGSSQAHSLKSLSGPGSSSRGDVLSNYEHSAEQGQSNGEDGPNHMSSKTGGDALPGSTRLKRLNIGNGTFLRGAPMRRPLRRRQSEEDQSPREGDDVAHRHEQQPSPDGDHRQPYSRSNSLKPSQEDVLVHDFAPEGIRSSENNMQDHHYPQQDQPDQRRSASRQERRHPSSASQTRNRSNRDHQEQPPQEQPVFRIPAPPQLPSFYDQENEPPPTFKRNNKPGILASRDKIHILDEQKEGNMLVGTPAEMSPQRPALAQKSINTPQRAAPPPPKMAPLDQPAVGAQGASTMKKRKRSHVTINGKIFSLKGRLGKGGSSDVYRVMAENDKMFALKKVNLEDCNEETVRGYKGEIDLLKRLENVERVVRLYDWELNEQKQVLSVLMEIGESDLNRVLSHRLSPDDSKLDLTFVRHYWREMLQCVLSVHDYDIVHSDLKPANFLLVQGRLKLIDFGIANAIDTDNTVNVHRETNVGTPNYMSPESLQDTNAEANKAGTIPGASIAKLMKLGKPSDVWSLGCILYQMTYGKPPFAHIPNQWNRVMAIINPTITISYATTGIGGAPVPASLRRLLKTCLNRDPAQRPTIPQMLDEKDAFLNPDAIVDKYEAEGAVPVTEHVLDQILNKIVDRCRDPKRGVPTTEEMKVYPRAFLDRVREMRGLSAPVVA